MIENKSAAIMAEITKAVIGKNDIVEKILMAVLAGGHVLMEDIPGVGKTTMALAFFQGTEPEGKPYAVHSGRYALGYHRFFHFSER